MFGGRFNHLSWSFMTQIKTCVIMLQPHGFFNCSPAVDVHPSAGDSEVKDSTTIAKLIPNNLLAKL
jgi:hypothetical protein